MNKGNHKIIEAFTGALVLLSALGFFVFAYVQSTQSLLSGGYLLKARFDRIDGLLVGSEVRVSGVKLGAVRTITLDPGNYLAVVIFDMASEVRIPKDSVAQVTSDGFLGGKFLSITPGAADIFLEPGGEITQTQSSISLEGMLSKFMFSSSPEKT